MHTLEKPDNLVELFENSVSKHGNNILFGTKNSNGEYTWTTYEEISKRVDNVRAGLASMGVNKGDTVGIIANNRTEWAIACYATYGRGARFVPMYEVELAKIWEYILTDSNTKVLFISKPEILEQLKTWPGKIKSLEKIILIDGTGAGTFEELEKIGEKNPVKSIYPAAEDIAGLIYTSGTTGEPKGVLLSHGNFSSNVHGIIKTFPHFTEKDTTLSFLPWAHSFGQIAELHVLVSVGASTGFAEKAETIAQDMVTVRPTALIAVPRIFNRVYDGIINLMDTKGGIAKALFTTGVKYTQKRRELSEKGKSSIFVNAVISIIDKIVFSKIRARFGGRLRFAVSASASLSKHIIEFFFDIKIPIYEGYGMTELSPDTTLNTPSAYKFGSVGKPIDKVRIVIDRSVTGNESPDGEIIVYGPNVMVGYHNKPDATKEVMTPDGGLRTGDRGMLDDEGFLHLTGRIKEQYKLENGKYVFPASIEEEIKLMPLVEQALIFGDGKPHNACLVFPDFIVLDKYAKENNLPGDHNELIKSDTVQKLYENQITDYLKGKFAHYEIPKKFILLDEGFTIDNGMLTPTMKLKRRNVLQKYDKEIQAIEFK